ncbi:hypothetical protein CHUAL_010025 [Chamberlinius hualienensis]
MNFVSLRLIGMVIVQILVMCFGQVQKANSPIQIEEIAFDVQISVPYSFLLPTFRRRRSVSTSDSDEHCITSDCYSEQMDFERMKLFISGMGVKDFECQKRLLCLMSQNPNKYEPLSDIILKRLEPRLKRAFNETSFTHFQLNEFYEAGRKGNQPESNCYQETTLCSYNPEEMINWQPMKTFQLVKQFINLRLK